MAINKPEFLIVHHAGGTDADPLADSSNFTFEQCNELHRKNFNYISSLGYYIGYHYYIDKYGNVKQGRIDSEDGAHAIGYNSKSIGICLAGNFDLTLSTIAQINALQALLRTKASQYNINPSNVVPHRAVAQKTCYGTKLDESWARNLLKSMVKFKISAIGYTNGVELLVDYCHNKLFSFSSGLLGLELVRNVVFPITANDKRVITDEQTVAAISKANLDPTAQQVIVVMHEENLTRPWWSTNYIAGTTQVPIMKAPVPMSGDTMLFELGHALISYYNENRDRATMPSISNVDNYSGGEQIVIDKVNKLMPYLSVFEKMPSVEEEAMRLIKEDGKNEVWLVKDQPMNTGGASGAGGMSYAGIRFWILDPVTRDSFGLPVVVGDPSQYLYVGALGRFNPDDPLK